jgi:hypothetical protein
MPATPTTPFPQVTVLTSSSATERQLALPLEPVRGSPPSLPSPLPPLGPAVPPRRVWRSLSGPMQETVRRAILRLCQQLAQELAQVAQEGSSDPASDA